ncbi:hypothetical protein SLE2022_371780 [Rubroshorea leprosula]
MSTRSNRSSVSLFRSRKSLAAQPQDTKTIARHVTPSPMASSKYPSGLLVSPTTSSIAQLESSPHPPLPLLTSFVFVGC